MFLLITICLILFCFLLGLGIWLNKSQLVEILLFALYLLSGYAWGTLIPATMSITAIVFILCVGIFAGMLTGMIISHLKGK